MIIDKNGNTAFVICFLLNCTFANAISIDWTIKSGSCPDCVKISVDEQSNYDFAVHKDRLFLSDYKSNTIKIYNMSGLNVKNIQLPAMPEIITVFREKLYILLRNNSLGVYSIDLDSFSTTRFNEKFTELEYSCSFFLDSMLAIPVTKDFFVFKSDARVFNVLRPDISDTIFGLFDFSKSMQMPGDSSFKRRPSKLIDLCGGNSEYFVLEKFESSKTFKSSGYILFSRDDRTVMALDPLPDKYGILLHSNAGRGMKIYNKRIYFISEGNNEIIVGSYSLLMR